jgi:adenosylmethionine-8-amino-7-oxononanoate aminotransferase
MAPEPGYYRRIGEICARYQVLFIADEIMSGMGRTGRWFSFEHYGVVPDIITIGKGLSGGYAPLSAVVASEPVVAEIARGSGAFNHAQTWSHMPASCAAGVAALRRIKRDGLVERAAAIEERFFEKLRSLYRFEAIGDIRGRGLMAGIEFVANRVSKRPFPRSERLAERFAEAAFANGLLVWTNVGHLDGDGDLVVIGPPLTISEAEMDELVERFGAAMG